MLRVKIDVNGAGIAWVECVRQPGGPDDGWNEYVCRCSALPEQPFRVTHNRPDGVWALVATVASGLAESGVGVRGAEGAG